MKNDVQLSDIEMQETNQSVDKRNLSIKQTRKGTRKVFPENSSSPGDTNSAKEANQYAFNMEKIKSRTAVKQEIYRPAEEISLPDVAI